MKKSSLLIPLAIASSLAVSLPAFATKGASYAAPRGETSRYHDGFYVGGSIGGNEYIGDLTLDPLVIFGDAGGAGPYYLNTGEVDSQTQSFGFGGQIQLGYGFFWDTFFIAAEVSVNGASGSNNMGQDSGIEYYDDYEGIAVSLTSDVDVELNAWEPVIDIKPGFKVGPNTLLYARVGAAWNTVEIKNTVHFTEYDLADLDPYAPLNQSLSTSDSNSVVGLRLGGGMEYRFMDNLAVNVDYVYTTYGDVSISGSTYTPLFGTDDVVDGGLSSYDKVDLTRDMVMIGLNYYF